MGNIIDKSTLYPAHFPGVECNENSKLTGYSIVEIFDELDHEFVEFYGEYGRKLVNEDREEWNRQGPWHFDLL